MPKPLMGVISEWIVEDNRVRGKCVFRTEYKNGICRGGPIYTSDIVRIYIEGGMRVCETKNSLYILQD